MADFFERIPQEEYNKWGEFLKAVLYSAGYEAPRQLIEKNKDTTMGLFPEHSRLRREYFAGREEEKKEEERRRAERAAQEPAPRQQTDAMPNTRELLGSVGGQDYVGDIVGPPAPPVDDMYVPQRAKLPEEIDADRHAQNWADFLKLNPNLDLDAVARQSGGNVPGGTFSEMPENNFPAGHPQSDESFYRWVDDFVLQQKLDEVQDPNSRTFNPGAAEQLIEAAKLRELQRQQQYLQEITRRSMSGEQALTPDEALAMSQSGVPYGVIDMIAGSGRREAPKGPSVNPSQLMSVVDSLENTINEGEDPVQKKAELDLVRYLIANERYNEANSIISKYLPQMGGGERDPENAPIPKGVRKLNENYAVAPNGDRIYIGK